ncbi:diguanylate cyclase [Shewanella halifaxensis HAW-EB4]|uniref:diguanylate cyclase n=1 Tax=Shewanella halifaxensis (strain HAW-EB4) TaxID=458817 RepID=B0TPB5_SHEHH|nr:diguanylate cyclase [Shewanella halifaxensis]ABZ77562.1 diguanylate cyclase [Shewanella halifaxensis HAW-EB4]
MSFTRLILCFKRFLAIIQLKSQTFNQLQLKISVAIFILFASAAFAYRIWVQVPAIERSLLKVSEQELVALNFAFEQMSKPLHTINYDYAVWDQTYNYMKSNSPVAKEYYEQHEYPDDTFKSLKVDGIFIFDNDQNAVFSKGVRHSSNAQKLQFELMDLLKHPESRLLSPLKKTAYPPQAQPFNNPSSVPTKTGVIATKYGPALYSSSSILQSDRTGPIMGYIVFIRLIDDEFMAELSRFTSAGVELSEVKISDDVANIPYLGSGFDLTKLAPTSQRLVRNIDGRPLIKFTLYHTNSAPPSILGSDIYILLAEMSILLLLAYFLYSYFLVQPVRKLAIDIEEMGRSREIKKLRCRYPITELVNVATHFNALMGTIQEQTKQLNEQVYIDKLTNIPNRRGFEQRLETYCQLLARQQIGFTLIIADVDHFKEYNDTLGHLAGDEALIKVAQTLSQQFFRADDICARFGGEEFIMLYRDIPDEPLQRKLDAMIQAFEDLALPHPSATTAKYVTISFGVCKVLAVEDFEFKNNADIIGRQAVLLADKALYQAKANGRNQYQKVTISIDEIETLESNHPSDLA